MGWDGAPAVVMLELLDCSPLLLEGKDENFLLLVVEELNQDDCWLSLGFKPPSVGTGARLQPSVVPPFWRGAAACCDRRVSVGSNPDATFRRL